jgi:hypothetical protein
MFSGTGEPAAGWGFLSGVGLIWDSPVIIVHPSYRDLSVEDPAGTAFK